jgi:hypothetical protein
LRFFSGLPRADERPYHEAEEADEDEGGENHDGDFHACRLNKTGIISN